MRDSKFIDQKPGLQKSHRAVTIEHPFSCQATPAQPTTFNRPNASRTEPAFSTSTHRKVGVRGISWFSDIPSRSLVIQRKSTLRITSVVNSVSFRKIPYPPA